VVAQESSGRHAERQARAAPDFNGDAIAGGFAHHAL
jgi:hypothetical protein